MQVDFTGDEVTNLRSRGADDGAQPAGGSYESCLQIACQLLAQEQSEAKTHDQLAKQRLLVSHLVEAGKHVRPQDQMLSLHLLLAAGRTLFRLGQFAGALEVASLAYESALVLGVQQPALTSLIAHIHHASGRFEAALLAFERTQTLIEAMPNLDSAGLVETLNDRAATECELGRLVEAEGTQRYALEVVERSHDVEPHTKISVLVSLAMVHNCIGRYADAEQELMQALALIDEDTELDPGLLTSAYGTLGSVYQELEDFPRAEVAHSRALTHVVEACGPNHPRTATTLANLAVTQQLLEKYEDAEASYLRALEIEYKVLGPENPAYAATLVNYGILLQRLAKWEGAEETFQCALKIERNALGPDHPAVARTLINLGAVRYELGDLSTAELLLSDAVKLSEAAFGPAHPQSISARRAMAQVCGRLGYSLLEGGSFVEAESYLSLALRLMRSTGPDLLKTAIVLANLASAQHQLGKMVFARFLLLQAHEFFVDTTGTEGIPKIREHLALLGVDVDQTPMKPTCIEDVKGDNHPYPQ